MHKPSALAIGLLLGACQAQDHNVPASDSPAQSGLERAAIERGVVTDASRVSPVGLFQRRTEAGRDMMCITPGNGRSFHFGIDLQFGAGEYCRAGGTARRAGDKLILNFTRGGRCIVVAQYDGDRVALPGVVDIDCAALCTGGGSLEGVALPRLDSDAANARAQRDREGAPLCP
jgi:hypothetical protein